MALDSHNLKFCKMWSLGRRVLSVAVVVFVSCFQISPAFFVSNRRTVLPARYALTRAPTIKSTSSVSSNNALIDRKGGIFYRTSLFTPQDLALISKDTGDYLKKLQPETSSSVAHQRTGVTLPPSSQTVRLLQSPTNPLTQLVRTVCNDDAYILAPEIPVQLRCYERPGASMAWHVDDVLYTSPDDANSAARSTTTPVVDDYAQIEVVWTLSNTSDCSTRWKMGGAVQHSCETDPNSVLLLRAGGIEHCVTSLRRGRRVILKCAYIRPRAKYIGDTKVAQQFQSKGTPSSKRRQRQR